MWCVLEGLCGGKLNMAYVRTVKFIYYTVCMAHYDDDGNRTDPERFDFESWIYKADELSLEQKTIEFDGIKARLEECVGDKSRGIWKFRKPLLRKGSGAGMIWPGQVR